MNYWWGLQRAPYDDVPNLCILLRLEPGVIWAVERELMGPSLIRFVVEAETHERASAVAGLAFRNAAADLGLKLDIDRAYLVQHEPLSAEDVGSMQEVYRRHCAGEPCGGGPKDERRDQ
jgi:hypothetical protein